MIALLLKSSFTHYRHNNMWLTIVTIIGIAVAVSTIVVIDTTSLSVQSTISEDRLNIDKQPIYTISNNFGSVPSSIYSKLITEGHTDIAPYIRGEIYINETRFQVIGIDMLLNIYPSINSLSVDSSLFIGTTHLLSAVDSNTSAPNTFAHLDPYTGQMVSYTTSKALDRALFPGNTLVGDLSTVQQLLGRYGEVDNIYIFAEKSSAAIDQIENLVSPLLLAKTSEDFDFANHILKSYSINLNAMGLLAILICVLLLYNTLSISLLQRQRDLVLYSSIGITSTSIALILFIESYVLICFGAGLGIAIGFFLSELIINSISSFGSDGYQFHNLSDFLIPTYTWYKIFLITSLALIIIVFLPFLSSRKLGEHQGFIAKYNSLFSNIRIHCLFLGVALFTAGYFVTYSSHSILVAYIGLFLQVIGLLSTIPAILSLYIYLLSAFSARYSVLPLNLSVNTIHSNRSISTVAVICLVLVLSVGQSLDYVVKSLSNSIRDWVQTNFEADAYISLQSNPMKKYFTDTERENINSLVQIDRTSAGIRTTQMGIHGKLDILALDLPDGLVGFLFDHPTPSFDRYQHSPTCLISEAYSTKGSIRVGDTIPLNTPSGTIPFEVIGVFKDYRPTNGLISISLNQYREYWKDDRIFSIGLFFKETSDTITKDDVSTIVPVDDVSITITHQIMSIVENSVSKTFYVMQAVKIGIVLVGLLGVIGSITIIILRNLSQYTFFWRIGLSPKDIISIILTSSILVGVLSGILAIPVGLLISFSIIDVINVQSFGWNIDRYYNFSTPSSGFAFSIIATLIGSLFAILKTSKSLSKVQSSTAINDTAF